MELDIGDRVMKLNKALLIVFLLVFCSCDSSTNNEEALNDPGGNPSKERSFGEDLEFLKTHTETILLTNQKGNGLLVITPGWQARVMTSSCDGVEGDSLGWINHELISSGEIVPHINAYGGEDRFWMGPEGGQFSIFFPPGAPFDYEHWQTPAFIDHEPFETLSSGDSEASFRREVSVVNYSGTEFSLEITRIIRMLAVERMSELLGVEDISLTQSVAFESENRVKNIGENAWSKEGGLLSIWILGMFLPSPNTTIIVPYDNDPDNDSPVVNDEYFGKVPAERLVVGDGVIFFSGDGRHRSKIGIDPSRAKKVLGSWDPLRQVLTLVHFSKPENAADYVNSMWKVQEKPFAGDVVNCYNDGIPAPGEDPLGPFYELETSSPALALEQGEEMSHFHRTFHFKGPREDLDQFSRTVLGVSLNEAEKALAVE